MSKPRRRVWSRIDQIEGLRGEILFDAALSQEMSPFGEVGATCTPPWLDDRPCLAGHALRLQSRRSACSFAAEGMDAIKHPDSIYLRAAQGWLELGNGGEALSELSRMSPASQEHPAALEIRWQVAVKNQHWEEGLALAELLCVRAPKSPFGWVHRCYCLHELKRTQEAWETLLPLAEIFPEDWLICYNLACYACQLGKLEEAKKWLTRAVEIGDPAEVNHLAAADADLKPLFEGPAA